MPQDPNICTSTSSHTSRQSHVQAAITRSKQSRDPSSCTSQPWTGTPPPWPPPPRTLPECGPQSLLPSSPPPGRVSGQTQTESITATERARARVRYLTVIIHIHTPLAELQSDHSVVRRSRGIDAEIASSSRDSCRFIVGSVIIR